MGEPTLAENLGRTIKTVKKLRKEPIGVLTNASLMNRKNVRKDLYLADFVIVKLDVYSKKSLDTINRPIKNIKFSTILKGIRQFKAEYKGKLALQIMFVEENKDKADVV